jgi:GH35 family endo-1,4-beta-xylanase
LYEKIGNGFDKSDAFIDRVQELIDKAGANGRDVSAVQAALDAFKEALKDAHPVYESAKGIINSHQGFDNDGKVTDPEKARETVRAMGEKLKEIKDAMDGTGRALHKAIRDFREANPRP